MPPPTLATLKAVLSEVVLVSVTCSAEYFEMACYSAAAWSVVAEIPVCLAGKMVYWVQEDADEDQAVCQDLGHIRRRPCWIGVTMAKIGVNVNHFDFDVSMCLRRSLGLRAHNLL